VIYHFLAQTWEEGCRTGVGRFDRYLRMVFPEMASVSRLPGTLRPHDVVVTDNHLSLDVPETSPCIVVHHGCALYHYAVDPEWRTLATEKMANDQRAMFRRTNRLYVAPSRWVADRFREIAGDGYAPTMLPPWVPLIERKPHKGKPVIIGDWRTFNKGRDHWQQIAHLCPGFDFRPLSFSDDAGRIEAYSTADAYLCLSLSEGFSYALADAEAAGLGIASTITGAVHEFSSIARINDRDDFDVVTHAVRNAARPRRAPSFYADYSFERWANNWQALVGEAQR
jgi:hypothetical protein